MCKPRLVLIRGLPGSGKSTMAKVLAQIGFCHFEADDYFTEDGVYTFNPDKLSKAHKLCQEYTRSSLKSGYDVVVSNTFTRVWELLPYLMMAETLNVKVDIIVATGNYQNIHGVPDETIQRMRERWEEFK